MSDIQSLVERGRSLLSQAFQRCEIPEGNDDEHPARFGDGNIYRKVGNEIEIVFSYYHMAAGSVYCSISLGHLAIQTAQSFEDDEEAIEALVDALKYFESSISALLPTTHHKLLRRMFNLRVRPKTNREQQKGWIKILEQLELTPSDKRTEIEKKLAAERDWRGGSEARLKEDERRSLHTQYDTLHEVARAAKKDYNVTLKRFAKSRAAKGYSRREWRNYWSKHVAENYPAEMLKDFLELFSNTDSPSASEVAYVKLSKRTRHKRSYLPQLVADSRKAAKVSTMKDRN